ncbi:MAG: hypothetical protein H7Z12_20305 [Rhodospirillaceae bacterium]|nr:hypothetical protein [Rhodospirillales bacterium]
MTFRVLMDQTEEAAGGPEQEALGPLLDRLEALSATLESIGAGDHSTEAVLETLSRMERRDLHAISAIDTFATALKSVSQHLAHVRQAVQLANAQNGPKLDALVTRLGDIEARLDAGLTANVDFDFSPMVAALDSISQRLAGLETKLDALPAQQQDHWPFDTDAFANALASIADRLARVEAKVDSVAQQPALEPEATNQVLQTIARRVSRVEHKVDSGADGNSIAACLLAVDHRLSRIEGGLGMDRPMPTADEIPDLVEVVDAEQSAEPPAEPLLPAEEEQPGGRERVDVLLEQVFKVLAR